MTHRQKSIEEINKLESLTLPFLSYNCTTKNFFNEFSHHYKNSQKWYQEMHKGTYEKIISKRFQRNEKKRKYENLPTETFKEIK